MPKGSCLCGAVRLSVVAAAGAGATPATARNAASRPATILPRPTCRARRSPSRAATRSAGSSPQRRCGGASARSAARCCSGTRSSATGSRWRWAASTIPPAPASKCTSMSRQGRLLRNRRRPAAARALAFKEAPGPGSAWRARGGCWPRSAGGSRRPSFDAVAADASAAREGRRNIPDLDPSSAGSSTWIQGQTRAARRDERG